MLFFGNIMKYLSAFQSWCCVINWVRSLLFIIIIIFISIISVIFWCYYYYYYYSHCFTETCTETIVPLVCKFCQQALSNEDSTLPAVAKQLGKLCHGLSGRLKIYALVSVAFFDIWFIFCMKKCFYSDLFCYFWQLTSMRSRNTGL